MASGSHRKRPFTDSDNDDTRSKRTARGDSPSTVSFQDESSVVNDDFTDLETIDLSKDEDLARQLEAEFLAEERARLEQEERDADLAARMAHQRSPSPASQTSFSQATLRNDGPIRTPAQQNLYQSVISLPQRGNISDSDPNTRARASGNQPASSTIDLTLEDTPYGMSSSLARRIAEFSQQVTNGASAGFQHLAEMARDAGFGAESSIASQSTYYQDDALYRRSQGFSASQQDYINAVVHDPAKTQEEILSLLQNIKPDVEVSKGELETPEGIKGELYKHQKIGLAWLKKMEGGSNKGGILADDMGLGKTIQMISLIISNKSDDDRQKTTLVVAPVALLRQWERECEKMVRAGSRLRIRIYHGQNRKISVALLRQYDVVITTYGCLGMENAAIEKWEKASREWEAKMPENRSKVPPMRPESCLFAEKLVFHRVILDEAQCIKNPKTQAARGACRLNANNRFCLTGTPMMNNVNELQSLIAFLRIRPYCYASKFREDIAKPLQRSSEEGQKAAMMKLQALLKATLLRRLKSSKIDGQPIVTLPPKTIIIDHAVFNEDERIFYDGLEQQNIIKFNKYLRAGTLGKHYSHILVLLLRLRQTCCHPHLVKNIELEAVEGLPEGDALEAAKDLANMFPPEVVTRIKGAESFECPVCYEPVENPAIFFPCGHDVCKECSIRIIEQANREGLAAGQELAGRARCPSCRGDVSENRIVDYAIFKLVYMPDDEDAEKDVASESETDAESETDIDSETDADVTTSDSDSDSETSGNESRIKRADSMEITVQDMLKVKTRAEDDKKRAKRKITKNKKKLKGKKKANENTLDNLRQKSRLNARNKRKYLQKLQETYVSSTKIDKCIEILEEVETRDPTEKTIVFSQWTSLLDLLEIAVNGKKWRYERYDGGMTAKERNDAVESFQDKDSCRLMLVSLRAGNAGLNLTVASQVVILDPFWNPYLEDQAIDRAYRIGQTRAVTVHRLYIKDSVEDRIIELQNKKRELIDSALDEGAGLKLSRLGTRELAFLFGVDSRSARNNVRNMAILPRGR